MRPISLISFLLLLLVNCSFLTLDAEALPENFQDTVIWSGLDTPTAIAFAPGGKVFIAEKGGIIKVFDNLQDTTPDVFADLTTQVLDFNDRGLLGLAVDPQFPTRPFVYAFFSLDAPIGGTPPVYNDDCEDTDYCPGGSRLVKLTATGNTATSQQILMEGWCQIETSHSVGTLSFGTDGALYVSHGDGASYNYVDYGQDGGCTDPVNEGGALRSQDLRTPADSMSYDGALLRVHPDTGAAFTGNPLAGGANTEDDRIISHGFRNPFRFSIDPMNGGLWIADVGWGQWEEVNYVSSPTAPAPVKNFGWPCYEGAPRQGGYDAADIPICENLYTEASAQGPYYSYYHDFNGSRAISGVALYRGTNFPSEYNGALFFGDFTQGWVKVMMPGSNGLPDITNIVDFIPSGAYPVDLKVGPNGALYYVDIGLDNVHQITYFSNNTPPVAIATATPTSGSLPLQVNFNGSGSSDPDAGDTIQYAWDLDGDGAFDDSTLANPTRTYTQAQTVPVKLRVTDSHNESSVASLTIYAGNRAPVVTISTPTASTLYNVGDSIAFSGSASDPDSGFMPASSLSWEVVLFHCAVNDPTECHEHSIQTFPGVSSGSLTAPDHEYPSRLEFRLTATDQVSPGLKTTKSVTIQPRTTTWNFTSEPSGLQLVAYGASAETPFSRTVIVNAQSTISAPSTQQLGTATYDFVSWSDAGEQTHNVTATVAPQTFHAVFNQAFEPSVWHSWQVMTQAGSPQAVAISDTNVATTLEFYESTNNLGITKGSLFNVFTSNNHVQSFNKVKAFWAKTGGSTAYPYAGKSTINRGVDVSEGNAPAPSGVRDLQLYPPNNNHTTVAAFRIPQNGTYTISDLGVRRVDANGTTSRLHVFNPQGVNVTTLTATNNQDWVTTTNTFVIPNVTAGQYIYFAVDRNGDYTSDATEISWTIQGDFSSPPPQPSCILNSNPGTIQQGSSTSLSWTTTNASSFSINQGVGGQASFGAGSVSRSPSVTTTYTGTVNGPGGTAQCSTTVTVNPPPSCSLTLTPATVSEGTSSSLSWTSQNATSFSIDQGIGEVTPTSGGSRSVSPSVTTTYTGTAAGQGTNGTCSATLTVTPKLIWNSWDVITQAGSPQAIVTSTAHGVVATIELYESTNKNGFNKGALFSMFTSGPHQAAANNVAGFWSNTTGVNAYPYAGKSTVGRGSDAGETNAPTPLGVLDLQLFPPAPERNTIAAFKVPQDGTYVVSKLGVRRVLTAGNNTRLRVYKPNGTQLISLNATNNRLWVTNGSQYFTLTNLVAGQYIYFAVDRNGDSVSDAAEISWRITKN